jgi:hypothetical protein
MKIPHLMIASKIYSPGFLIDFGFVDPTLLCAIVDSEKEQAASELIIRIGSFRGLNGYFLLRYVCIKSNSGYFISS